MRPGTAYVSTGPRTLFEQGYKSNWTGEIFTIHSVNQSGVHPRYKVRDDEGSVIQGSF